MPLFCKTREYNNGVACGGDGARRGEEWQRLTRLFSSRSLLVLVVRHLFHGFINALNLALQILLLRLQHQQVLLTLANQTTQITLDAGQRARDEPAARGTNNRSNSSTEGSRAGRTQQGERERQGRDEQRVRIRSQTHVWAGRREWAASSIAGRCAAAVRSAVSCVLTFFPRPCS